MAKIRIGLAGCGFVSELHMYAYRRVYGMDVDVKAVAARATTLSILPAGTRFRPRTAAFAT
jgi:hypothetical protein